MMEVNHDQTVKLQTELVKRGWQRYSDQVWHHPETGEQYHWLDATIAELRRRPVPTQPKTVHALAQEVLKLTRYVTCHITREMKVASALGKPGVKHLEKMEELADTILETDV